MMVNTVIPMTISHPGIDGQSPMQARRNAAMHFSMVNGRAKWRAFWQKLLGKENKLQNLNHVAATAKRLPAKQAGIVNVPLEKIVGSEGRAQDFDSKFNPLSDHVLERWVGILSAQLRGVRLPPVALIQVNDEYFVHDGHHRISVANAVGQKEIEARILYKMEN